MRRPCLAAFTLLLVLVTGDARSQSSPVAAGTSVDTYYQAPDPDRVAGLMQALEDGGTLRKWSNRPPVVGFMAVQFVQHPERIEAWLAAARTADLIEVYAVALSMAGDSARAQSLAAEKLPPDRQAAVARPTGTLMDMPVSTATALDVLWGASFASGDVRYVQRIIASLRDLLAATPYPTEDLLRLYDAFRKAALRPYAREVIDRYGDADKRRLLFATTALWALTSNAAQHGFVAEAVAASERAHAGTSFARLTARARFRRDSEPLVVTADRVMMGLTQGPALLAAMEQNDIKRAIETGFSNDFTVTDGLSIGVLAMVRAGDVLTFDFKLTSPRGVVTTLAPVTVATKAPAAVEANLIPLEAFQLSAPGIYTLDTVIGGLPGGRQRAQNRFLISPP